MFDDNGKKIQISRANLVDRFGFESDKLNIIHKLRKRKWLYFGKIRKQLPKYLRNDKKFFDLLIQLTINKRDHHIVSNPGSYNQVVYIEDYLNSFGPIELSYETKPNSLNPEESVSNIKIMYDFLRAKNKNPNLLADCGIHEYIEDCNCKFIDNQILKYKDRIMKENYSRKREDLLEEYQYNLEQWELLKELNKSKA